MRKNIFVLAIVAFGLACGSSSVSTSSGGFADESILPPSFSLSSDFPADIVIPDIDGMKSTAFIVSTSMPSAVIAVNIDKNPMQLSDKFAGMASPRNSGIPARLVVSGIDEAFLLTSTSIIYFSPQSGYIYYNTSATRLLDIGSGLENSDGSAAASTITPSFPSGMTRIGDLLFVATANYISTETPSVTAPGTVQVFEIQDGRALERVGFFVTSAYNPTGLASRNDRELIVTNSGVLNIIDAKGAPATDSVIDVVDPFTLEIISSLNLGMAAASFHPVRLTHDGSIGFVGSHSYPYIYEIDFINKQVLRGIDNPIIAGESDSDYITDIAVSVDDAFMYAASFEQSTVFPYDLQSVTDPVIGEGLVVGYPAGVTAENPTGANTGAGPIAVRPGSRGIDYEGADLFILTSYPGTLVAAISDAPALAYVPDFNPPGDEADLPPLPPEGSDDHDCRGFAQSVHSVSYGNGAGFGQNNYPNVVLGPPKGGGAGQGGTDVLSLGIGGEIVLDLGSCRLIDGPGYDFIVFENAFLIGGKPSSPFKELGIVSVSNDGINFLEFHCHNASYPYDGCAGWSPVYSHPNNDISPFDANTAGGDAFDLSDLGVTEARYIKIRDLEGFGAGGAAGFDLDAVSVINGKIKN